MLKGVSMSRAFTLVKTDLASAARLGVLHTRHGDVPTPIFMPVGTQGTVKALTPVQLQELGARIILGNTYHLNLRPGSDLIHQLGGLHTFMGWSGPILTDSGGFQVFSLAQLREVTDEGITFRSHLDGARVHLSPPRVVEIQDELGSDIAMVLDECPPAEASAAEVQTAVHRTLAWAAQCNAEAGRRGWAESGRHLFAIVQGGRYPELRQHCAESLVAQDFPGYAIGGVSVGESEAAMLEQVGLCTPLLPAAKPRYVMGVGTPVQLLKMIALGADMFDCVMPTREARHGLVYTRHGRLNLKNNRFRDDPEPIDAEAANYVTRTFSRAYLRHLLLANEMLAGTLLSYHNLHFFLGLMEQARSHLATGDFLAWSEAWIATYLAGEQA